MSLTTPPTCQYGQTTREEYRRGVRRELCTRPATSIKGLSTPAGTAYTLWLCADHVEVAR